MQGEGERKPDLSRTQESEMLKLSTQGSREANFLIQFFFFVSAFM